MSRADAPAYPANTPPIPGCAGMPHETGMTVREVMAMHIAAGLAANPALATSDAMPLSLSSMAIVVADNVIAELERTENK